ncbi:heme utilization cystosolic carrier protein HutX [Agrobacterium salinitolerans]|uniref:heme utilization cystosolic carrier protein HutX n=1 Tax=Agrobacterium salinitolerans TaxID=1183413 RepID=UPI0022B82A83|nr:heme utilization cystosolic carrier protein HutX [Agrobacterium salinitolerans]MCZ7887666.1 heme utilization cystosolic carrier protein HutX [Agrobacterium salinitolerans]
MSIAAQKTDGERRARAAAALAEKPDGVVEAIAAKAEVTPAEILAILPQGAAVSAAADRFDTIWNEMRGWGEVLMIVQTGDIVFEVPGHLPEGNESHGWFNIHGDSPIGGHIKKDNCAGITFVDRGFHGRRSCSVWFMNAAGSAMFKIFVRRDENKELRPEQLARFEALRDGFRG